MKSLLYPVLNAACLSVFVSLISGCGRESACKNDGPAGKPQIQVQVVRLENELDACSTRTTAHQFLQRHPAFTQVFLSPATPDTAAVADLVIHHATDTYLDTMLTDVKAQFPTNDRLNTGFSELFSNIKGYFPTWPVPRVYTLISGFSIDLNYIDTALFIGLEHFTNDSAHYEAPQIPRYIKRRLQPNTVVSNVALVLSDQFNKTAAGEAAMLEEMVRWGKALYFVEKTMPCVPDTVICGYTATELEAVNANRKRTYDHFVERHLFFENDRLLVAKYTGERPNTPEIGDKAPGRLGRWMGWQIVRKYAEEKKLSLPEVMAQPNAKLIFDQARWRPE